MDLSIIGKIESSAKSRSIPAESAHNLDQETTSEPNEHVNQDQPLTTVEANVKFKKLFNLKLYVRCKSKYESSMNELTLQNFQLRTA
jgi:hypothetical protein